MSGNLCEPKFFFYFSFWAAEMAHDDDASAFFLEVLDCWECCGNTAVVFNLPFFILWNVEVDAKKDALTV